MTTMVLKKSIRKSVLVLTSVLVLALSCGLTSCTQQKTSVKVQQSYTKTMKSVELTKDNELSAIKNGVKFLLENQNKDGSWGNFYEMNTLGIFIDSYTVYSVFQASTTAIAAMSLLEAEKLGMDTHESLVKAVAYLMDFDPRAKRSSGQELYSVWSIVFVGKCLARVADRDDLGFSKKQVHQRLQEWMRMAKRFQAANGGWSYYSFDLDAMHPTGSSSTSFTTASMMLTIREWKQAGLTIPKELIRPPMIILETMRMPGKCFTYAADFKYSPTAGPSKVKGSLGRTQVANLASYLCGGKSTIDDMTVGLDNFFKYHYFIDIARGRPVPHETWYQNAAYYYGFGHFFAAEAIAYLPKDKQTVYWPQLSQIMLNSQQSNGSWVDFPLRGYGKHYATGFGLYTMIKSYNFRE